MPGKELWQALTCMLSRLLAVSVFDVFSPLETNCVWQDGKLWRPMTHEDPTAVVVK
jgi:hypothetical protein